MLEVVAMAVAAVVALALALLIPHIQYKVDRVELAVAAVAAE
jgi:hypothetical protein